MTLVIIKIMRNTKTGEFMKRSRLYRLNQKAIKRNAVTYRRNSLLAAGVLGILFGLIVSPIVYKWLNPPMLDPLQRNIEVGAVEITPTPKPYCRDAISCIRDIGEKQGRSNKTIMTMIRIAQKKVL